MQRVLKGHTYYFRYVVCGAEEEVIGTVVTTSPNVILVNCVTYCLGIQRDSVLEMTPY